MLLIIKTLDKIDYVSGYVQLIEHAREDECIPQGTSYLINISQYCEALESIKVSALPEARKTFVRKCEEYKEKLSQGRRYIEFQLAESEDGLWEFQSDGGLPGAFYDLLDDFYDKKPRVGWRDLPRKTFKNRDEAINFGRTCRGRWKISVHGHYNIVDKSGEMVRAMSLKHIDWGTIPED